MDKAAGVSADEAATSSRARLPTFRDVLRIPEYRALYIAQTMSVAGDQMARIAVAVLVFKGTGSTFLTGLSYAVSYLPWLIGGPLLSGYADHRPRRTVMIVCDVARMIVVLLMAVPGLPTAALIGLVILVGLGEPPFASARTSMVPDIVGEGDLYAVASTLGNTTSQLAVVLGFALGGALVASTGPHGTLFLDAVTFGLSALVTIRYVRFRPAAKPEPGHWFTDLREGARVVFHDARLRWLVVVTWLILGMIVSTEAAAVPYAHAHGKGSATAGLLIASLPLGIIIGALILGRMVPLATSERLMLPLSLIAPILLAFTAFNPAPAVAGVLWCLTGIASAMTVTANRVFVVAVPREVRGRAFGIAVTGISASQGIYSLLTGLIAGFVGPAHAIADLALPTLALIVVFSTASATFSIRATAPIPEVSPGEDEDPTMLPPKRHPRLRVWVFVLVLVAAALAAIPLLRGKPAYSDIGLPAWWLFAVFVIGQTYPLRFKLRRQAFEVILETVPLVLCLMFVPPLELVALRTGAMALVYAVVHRQTLVQWTFNVAGLAVCTVAAIEVFRAIAPAGAGAHLAVWPATFAAVIVSEVLAGLLVIIVMLLSGGPTDVSRTVRPIAFAIVVSVVMTFLALVTAAALEYDVSTAWAISVFVVLVIAASQTYHRLAERAAALDRLYVVARELGPIAADPSDLAPALIQLRQVIRASTLELAIDTSADHEFLTVVTVSESGNRDDRLTVEERAVEGGLPTLLARTHRDRRLTWLFKPAKASKEGTHRLSAAVRTNDRVLGVLSAVNGAGDHATFDGSDHRLIEAAADQLAAAIEKGRLIESLRRAATLDTLTGLANLDSLRSFLDTSLEGSAGGVLILLNIDRFREVNDMLGHGAGDTVLAEVARRLESAPIQGALVARVGGDQFAIAIPGAAGSDVARLAAMAVKSRVDGSIRLAEVSADVRVTVGIARAPDHGSDAATLLRRAEMAMAAAKGGSSGIGEWEPDYERDGSRRLELLTGLRSALSDGSLRVAYQPKLQIDSGEVTGFEALVRWTHPQLGPVAPSEFVPLAEATGLISALTSTVLRSALTTCRAWHDAGKPVGVAVNISARSLDESVLVGQVAAMLTASGIEPRWLTLEITESSVMEDQSRSVDVLRELRMLGVRLSIDDFGTGYSSLHQLRGLPVHEVKIDRSFIETVDVDETDRAVVHAVVELCDSLGLVTVAEGVEKASQSSALETLGVRQVQGFFHGRPMTDQAAMDWLLNRRIASLATY
jgi:diguanylate cyclase (GGDEF)-like protein